MKKRNLVVTVLGLVAAGTITGGALLTNAAGAAPEAAQPAAVQAGALVAVTDQQNLQTDLGGRVVLDLRDGEEVQQCLSDRIDAFLVQNARNNDPTRSFAVSVQAVENTDCSVKLRFFDVANNPLGGENLRIAYHATTQNTVVAPGVQPEPEPTPEPDPDPEPGDSLLKNQGGTALPQGVTPLGDVEPGAYSGVVPADTLCYAAFLGSLDVNNVVHRALVEFTSTETNLPVTVPEDANDNPEDGVQFDHDDDGSDPEPTPPVTARFIHVDCAA